VKGTASVVPTVCGEGDTANDLFASLATETYPICRADSGDARLVEDTRGNLEDARGNRCFNDHAIRAVLFRDLKVIVVAQEDAALGV
jgi:hypothetical protein